VAVYQGVKMILTGNLEIFDDKRCGSNLKKILSVQFPQEKTLFCVITNKSALIALEDRIIYTYKGIQIETHFFRDILSIDFYDVFIERGINIDSLNKRIKITFSSKEEMSTFTPYAKRLTDLAAEAKSQRVPAPSGNSASQDYMISQLERLAALRRTGDLTDKEFETAKAKLLQG
jgi:hypothetical protein